MTTPLLVDVFAGDRATALATALGAELLPLERRRFPDGESLVRIAADVAGRDVVLAAALDDPDPKLMTLILAADALRELGAARVLLATPYLPYMRQDARFVPGEAVAARSFARLISAYVDAVATVDPHLHRIHALSQVFSVPARVAHAAPAMAAWIAEHIADPVIVGPDEESEQWVADVAARIQAPHTVFIKTRHGDHSVTLVPRDAERLSGRTPVIVDDIVSTARTMAAAVEALRAQGYAPPWCLGVHALFVGDAWAVLSAAGPAGIVTCDTVAHPSNAIAVMPALAAAVHELLALPPCAA